MRVTHDSKVLAALRAGPQTSAALYELGCIAHSRVASLRAKGHVIECRRVPGERRSSIAYEYTLVSSPLDGKPLRVPPLVMAEGFPSSGVGEPATPSGSLVSCSPGTAPAPPDQLVLV